MTQMVERFTITVDIEHDSSQEISALYLGPRDLKDYARKVLPKVIEMAFEAGPSRWQLKRDGLSITWEHTGLFEAPEVGGGDN